MEWSRMSQCRVILQGFGPFGGYQDNPSALLVESLASQPLAGVDVMPLVLPVSHHEVVSAVASTIERERPDVWLGVGLAVGRPSVAMEQVAVNVADYEIDDIDGSRPKGEPLHRGGPSAYLTSLPARQIVQAWRQRGVPGFLSYSAGAYLCNESFYLACAAVDALGLTTRVGFLHVPLLPGQVRKPETEPSMSLDVQRRAALIALECITSNEAVPTQSNTLAF